jgi:hypothetical protein
MPDIASDTACEALIYAMPSPFGLSRKGAGFVFEFGAHGDKTAANPARRLIGESGARPADVEPFGVQFIINALFRIRI